MSPIPILPAVFRARVDRSRFIATQFAPYLQGNVLDVGCDEGHLRALVPGIRYTGIDIGGKPDLRIDLEATERLPFPDGAFDTVVCSDVLEHLDSLHRAFGELVRVSARWLIISLPNNWANARRPIERGTGSFAHYGLPAEQPKDRHKWFFSLEEAYAFFLAQERRYPIRLTECFANDKPRNPVSVAARRLRYPDRVRYLNRYAHTLWARYERRSEGA